MTAGRLLHATVAATLAFALCLLGVGAHAATGAVKSASSPSFVVTLDAGAGADTASGAAFEFDNEDANLDLRATKRGQMFELSSEAGDFFMQFGAPIGHRLHDGFYRYASFERFGAPGVANLQISGGANACYATVGSFDVRDVKVVHGAIIRLDLVYYAFCDGGDTDPQLMGEVRVNEPSTTGVVVSTSDLMWGVTDPGLTTLLPAAVWLRNTTAYALHLGKPSISGPKRTPFHVVSNSCGSKLAPNRSCALGVAFAPRAAGPQSAGLNWRVGLSNRTIPLSGIGANGTSRLVVHSPSGDGLPTGDFDFTLYNSIFWPGVSTSVQSITSANNYWFIDAAAKNNARVVVGDYLNANRSQGTGKGNMLDISGGSYGCNTSQGHFDVAQAVYGGFAHQYLNHYNATYVQRCTGTNGTVSAPVTVQFEFDYSTHLSAPQAPRDVRTSRRRESLRISWARSGARDVAYSMVRISRGAGDMTAPNSGTEVYEGAARSAVVHDLEPGRDYTITVYDVDRYGNVSRGSSRTV